MANVARSRFEELLVELAEEHRQALEQARLGEPGTEFLVSPLRKTGEASSNSFSRQPPLPGVLGATDMSSQPFDVDQVMLATRSMATDAPSSPGNRRRSTRVDSEGSKGSMSSNGQGMRGVAHVKRMMTRFSLQKESSLDEEQVDQASSLVKRAGTFIDHKKKAIRTKLEEFNPAATEVFSNNGDEDDTVWCFTRMVKSPSFELAMSALIFLNTVVLAVEAQWDGIRSGYDNELSLTPGNSDDVWPGAKGTFEACELCFGILFTAEFLVKVIALRMGYFLDPWNFLDFTIVAFWLLDSVFLEILPMDPKLVRVFRLARLLRFLRVVKTIQAFDSLYLMMASIKSSLSALAWSSVVLLLLEMMLALFLNVVLEDSWTTSSAPEEDRRLLYAYFGTFTRALQTMVEMLLGNWYTITRLLTEKVSEWWVLFGVSHQLVVGFAVIEVITGVFLHQTFQVANMDDGILLNETKREIKYQTEKMLRFFFHADTDGNGTLSQDEFKQCLEKDKVQEWMNAMGLDTHQVEKVFNLFDVDKSGTISPEELVAGTLALKGQAKAMDLALVRSMVEETQELIKRFYKECVGPANDIDSGEGSSWTPRSQCSDKAPGRAG